MTQPINEPMNHRIDESTNQGINATEPMTNESANHGWMSELLTCSSLSDLFPEVPLLSATSSLSNILSGLLLL